MFRINLKSSIATVAVIAGVVAVAGPASASSMPLQTSLVMAPNGGVAHEREPSAASSAAQKDGSSNTLMVVAVQGVTAKTPSLTAEGHLYAGVVRTSAGFKSLSGMDSETEFMDYTDDSLLD